MEFKKDKQYIIITSYPYQYLILKYKSFHPELNIKIIDIAQAKTDLSYSFSLDAYKYLIKNNISYSKAKKYLEVLPYLDNSSLYLNDLFLDMKSKGLFIKDEIKQFAYKGKEIYLFECKEERTLKTLLDRNKLPYSFLSITDLGYQKKENKKIEVFEDLFEEYMYVFSSIRKDVQEDKIPLSNIEIITPIDDDLFYLNYFSSLFKIPLSMKVRHPLISDDNCLKLIQYFEKNRTFVVNFDNNNEIDMCIKKIIEDYDLASLSDFNYALLNLKEIISRHTISFPSSSGLSITSSLSYKEHMRHYVLGVQHGNFYKIYDDDSILSDSQLVELGLTTSYDKTRLDQIDKTNFITYKEVTLLARCKRHQSDKIYPSQLIKQLDLEEEKGKLNIEGVYTPQAYEMVYSSFQDEYFLYNYHNKYDYQYKPFNISGNKKISVTGIGNYSKCPFYYYYGNIIKIDEFSYSFFASLGNVFHKICEKVYDDDFDLDVEFEKAISTEYQERGRTLTSKERVLLEKEKENFKLTLELFKSHKEIIKDNTKILSEHRFKGEFITTSGEKYILDGVADKAYITTSQGRTYLSIVDFKTGDSDVLDETYFPLGLGLQLPLYLKMLLDKNKEYRFGGLYYMHITPKLPGVASNQFKSLTDKNERRFKGNYCMDNVYQTSFAGDKVSSLLAKKKKSATITSDEEGNEINIEKYFAPVVVGASKAIEGINNNAFPVAPLKKDENDFGPCKFCKFKDICYSSGFYRIGSNLLQETEEDSDE